MAGATLRDVYFDEADRNLFLVDDARLRADALRHSVLPRLNVVMHHCVGLVREVYGVEALDDSIISLSPNFRSDGERVKEFGVNYEAAGASLGGKRARGKWHGYTRKDGKPPLIVPFLYGVQLASAGLCVFFQSEWLRGGAREWWAKVFEFHLEHESVIACLARCADYTSDYDWPSTGPVMPLHDLLELMLLTGHYRMDYGSSHLAYPVSRARLAALCDSFVTFFPVYDSYIQIALGKAPRLLELVGRLNAWLVSRPTETEIWDDDHGEATGQDTEMARDAAADKTRVMPALRWQVFQRDNWRCVADGKGAADGVILEVDHIIPRSKGGKDTLDNLQTLCNICNRGKSNRDQTDLRQRR